MDRQMMLDLDANDRLKKFRDKFYIPHDTLYFDGNSLGMAPLETKRKMIEVIEKEWGQGLIRSWADEDWAISGQRVGNKIAKLIGANEGEVIAADSTSINIFKAIAAALQCNRGRKIVLSTDDNFPTDLYMMQGLEKFSPERIKGMTVKSDQILDSLNEEVAAILLTEVNYKTGQILDMRKITAKAHEKGILVIWDLSHSAGSIPVHLNKYSVDFAVGCGYKFLNGGPGAPAFIFISKKHQKNIYPILSGWMGHKDPFEFSKNYTAANGIDRFLCGTPPLLGLIALECGVDLVLEADLKELRKKAIKLSVIFIELMERQCNKYGFKLASPNNNNNRAGHVSFRHANGFSVSRALAADGVIGDFRVPDIIRFGIAPIYTRYQDVYDAVERIKHVMKLEKWKQFDQKVTSYT